MRVANEEMLEGAGRSYSERVREKIIARGFYYLARGHFMVSIPHKPKKFVILKNKKERPDKS